MKLICPLSYLCNDNKCHHKKEHEDYNSCGAAVGLPRNPELGCPACVKIKESEDFLKEEEMEI